MNLHQAVLANNTELVRQLVAIDGIEGIDVNAKDNNGYTPLHIASRNGYSDIVNVLIAAGADVNAKNKYGNTPLHYASDNENLEIVKILIAAGADVSIKNKYNKTPLDIAIVNGHLDVVKVLKQALDDQNPIKEPDFY